jgi:hypothetical protein
VRAQVDRDLTTVSWVDRLLGLIKNLGCHSDCDEFDDGGAPAGDGARARGAMQGGGGAQARMGCGTRGGSGRPPFIGAES